MYAKWNVAVPHFFVLSFFFFFCSSHNVKLLNLPNFFFIPLSFGFTTQFCITHTKYIQTHSHWKRFIGLFSIKFFKNTTKPILCINQNKHMYIYIFVHRLFLFVVFQFFSFTLNFWIYYYYSDTLLYLYLFLLYFTYRKWRSMDKFLYNLCMCVHFNVKSTYQKKLCFQKLCLW